MQFGNKTNNKTEQMGNNRGASKRRHAVFGTALLLLVTSNALAALDPADAAAQQQLRQEERERALRSQQELRPNVRQQVQPSTIPLEYPLSETPCFNISSITLAGDAAEQFKFALAAVTSGPFSAVNRCLGVQGINVAMAHVQNAIIAQGFVTTRVLVAPQDLKSGQLTLTIIPGRIRNIRFSNSNSRVQFWNALPADPGDILNLRDIEQGLENLKRVPTADADIQIEAADGKDAKPGESDIVIHYRQALPFRLTLSLDDSGFDTTGKYQAGITLSSDNLLTLNDLFYVNFNHDLGGGDTGDRGSHGHTVHYSLPYGYWLFGATASGYDYHQQVAGINQSYIYSGRTQNVELKVSRLVYRNAINKTIVSAGSFFKKSYNYIDDTEIEVQRRRTTGWLTQFNQSWYLGRALLDYTVGYRRGTGALDSLEAPEEDLGEGTSRMEVLTADIGFSLPFTVTAPWGSQTLSYSANVRAQSNLTPLTPQDRFAIGNRYTVRGFDGELTLSADRGWFIRNELAALIDDGGQAIYAGLDYGEVGGQSSDFLPAKRLAGGVLGVRGGYKSFSYDCFIGRPIEKPQGFETARVAAGFNLNWTF
ncbi:MAG TPA: ShlB/FhaC/HecB family hemolysin secretion/activation protein [Methylophilaceae bacterium]|nr:ShlB/FhaC/HecB family hemolysin secretion/activation protein [Methylophilaceae bacterium]